ncbi:hypothetical protein KSP40_PGU009924 [Platanthera guangdongensis]|uniref:Uncharacterized protein n=1 Tax=Platanthera guangdongensis TaxID=2320717 RepID=A0ABR2MM14_9ASPA
MSAFGLAGSANNEQRTRRFRSSTLRRHQQNKVSLPSKLSDGSLELLSNAEFPLHDHRRWSLLPLASPSAFLTATIPFSSFYPSRQSGTSTLDNVDEWKWKFSMLLRNDSDQELVSRERKDRRDYEHIAIIAERMRLYRYFCISSMSNDSNFLCVYSDSNFLSNLDFLYPQLITCILGSHQYAKVVVFSKVPLPNYRPDLDDKRPQREVSIPIGLQREVDSLLTDYLSRKSANLKSFPNTTFSRSSSADSLTTDEGFFEQQDTQNFPPIMREKLLRRSLQLRNQQSTWQFGLVIEMELTRVHSKLIYALINTEACPLQQQIRAYHTYIKTFEEDLLMQDDA